jgi:4-amino-4-deoxy-L-arabinose transferase-like glycosyltransferase
MQSADALSSRFSRQVLLFLTGIVAIAALLRLYKLGEWSFWVDEMWTLYRTPNVFDSPAKFIFSAASEKIIRIAQLLFSTSEFSTRLFPALIGIATIPALFVLARRVFGVVVALLACALLAVSPWHIYFSQNARYFALFILLYMLTAFAFYFSLERNRFSYLILSVVLLGFTFIERGFGLFLVIAFDAYIVLLPLLRFQRPPGYNRRLVLLFIVLPLVGYVLFEVYQLLTGGQTFFARFLNTAYLGEGTNMLPQWVLTNTIDYIGNPLSCLAVYGAIVLLWQRKREGLFFSLIAFSPVLILTGIAFIGRAEIRYSMGTLPFWALLAAFGVRDLFAQVQKRRVLVPLAVLLSIVAVSAQDDFIRAARLYFGNGFLVGVLAFLGITALAFAVLRLQKRNAARALLYAVVLSLVVNPLLVDGIYYFYQHGFRDDYRAAAQVVSQQMKPNELVYTSTLLLGEYYVGKQARAMREEDGYRTDGFLEGAVNINTMFKDNQDVWFLEDLIVDTMTEYQFIPWSEKYCQRVGIFDGYQAASYSKLQVFHCTTQQQVNRDQGNSAG